MDIIISNTSGVPIYEQIEEQIKSQIMTGSLVAGEALPSMRVLAKELKISIITTKRAYEDLERDGFIESVTKLAVYVSKSISQIPLLLLTPCTVKYFVSESFANSPIYPRSFHCI